MAKFAILLAVLTLCSGCSKPSLKDALAQCEVEARREIGPVQDNDPTIADCMDGKGYEIRSAECASMESPARVEGCYRLRVGGKALTRHP
jgi:hypothetical protein